jgi:hypothetical protein
LRVTPFYFRPLAFNPDSPHTATVISRVPFVCLALIGSAAFAQNAPDKSSVKVTGYRVSAEGGTEGTITYRYDENGRPIDGAPRPTVDGKILPPPDRTRTTSESKSDGTPDKPTTNQPLQSADGRPLSFQLTGKSGLKTVDPTVDADSALRALTKSNGALDKNYQAPKVDILRDSQFATDGNTVSIDRWQGKFSTMGGRIAGIELVDSLDANVRPKNLIEIKSVDMTTADWSGRIAQPDNWDDTMGGEAEISAQRVAPNSLAATVAERNTNARSPRNYEQLSMQDLNRYQFRRARSTDPGIPVGRPGSDTIQNK